MNTPPVCTPETAPIERGAPLLIVDVDEVLVSLAAHLAEFVAGHGYRLHLTSYKLDGALRRADGGEADASEFGQMFRKFFVEETRKQRIYPGARAALERLSRCMNVVILTNVPDYAVACRVSNLAGHGIGFPLIANSGPKGPALARLWERSGGAASAFIDDSPSQLASSAEHAPKIARVHFIGDGHLRGLAGAAPDGEHFPESWHEIEPLVHSLLCCGSCCR